MPDDITTSDDGLPLDDSKERVAQRKLFGPEFPPLDTKNGKLWKRWIEARIREQDGVRRDQRLHWARHRHFRQGRQWISTRDGRTWREVEADQNDIRQVLNLFGPSIDYRVGLIDEQRPGFRATPLGTGVEAQETAEAQQRLVEHHYNKNNSGKKLFRDAAANAQTDGTSFLHVYVDKSAGPRTEDVRLIPPDDSRYAGLVAAGYELDAEGLVRLPLTEEGSVAGPEAEVITFNAGEIATRVILAHEVYFDVEAKTVNGPYDRAKWSVIRRVRDLNNARLETGKPDLKEDPGTTLIGDPILDNGEQFGYQSPLGYQRSLPPYPSSRRRYNQPGVFDFLVYLAPNAEAGILDGLWRHVIGDELIDGKDELPGKRIPLARFTDGSSDTEMFVRPVVSDWLPDQMSINALVSTLLQHARIFGLGRVMAQKGTILSETYTTIIGAILEYQGPEPKFQSGTSASADVWRMLEVFIKKFEDKSGWNDLARGAMGNASLQDVSGRALLGARELFERTFGPLIRATAEGGSEWANLIVDFARYLYTTPRLIPLTDRGDLAKKISSQDLGEESQVYIAPETLSPMPKALRNQTLYDLAQNDYISRSVYMRNAPFGEIRDVYYGGQEQWERAQWVNMLLEERWQEFAAMPTAQRLTPESQGVAIWWQDEPSVHKEALQQIMLDEKKPLALRDLAAERWVIYDQLGRAKGSPGDARTPPIPPSAPPPADLQTGMPLVRGMPIDIAMNAGLPSMPTGPRPPAPAGGAPSGPPQLVSPSPDIAPGVTQSGQQSLIPLGEFGAIEEQLQDRQEF